MAGIVLALAISAGWFFIGGASGDPGSGDAETAAATSSAPADDSALTGLERVVPSLVPVELADPANPPADPAATGAPAEGAAPAEPAAPVEPGPCPDAAIALAVGAEFGQYEVGSKPRFGLNVTNIGAVACIRDLDAALQTWGLFALDGTRLWGSNDCYPSPSIPTPAVLQPGQVVAFSIIWSGKSSEPTCSVQRQLLGPGTYVLRGFLGVLVSPDAGLVLT